MSSVLGSHVVLRIVVATPRSGAIARSRSSTTGSTVELGERPRSPGRDVHDPEPAQRRTRIELAARSSRVVPARQHLLDEQLVDRRAPGVVCEDAVQSRDLAAQRGRGDHHQDRRPRDHRVRTRPRAHRPACRLHAIADRRRVPARAPRCGRARPRRDLRANPAFMPRIAATSSSYGCWPSLP